MIYRKAIYSEFESLLEYQLTETSPMLRTLRARVPKMTGSLALLSLASLIPCNASTAYADSLPVQFGQAEWAGSFNFGYQLGFDFAVSDLYPVDLDGDGRDELIIAGFETQPNTPENYQNTRIVVFGWSGAEFTNITSKWFPGVDRIEGTNDIAFGDFNGDGLVDLATSAYTDMDFAVNAYEFTNQRGYFTRRIIENTYGQHGTTVADINGDGYDDVVNTSYHTPNFYLGGPTGLTKYDALDFMAGHSVSIYNIWGSDISAGKFTHGPVDDFIVVDGFQDTQLVKSIENGSGQFGFEISSVLSPPAMSVGSNPPGSHDVRALTFDFNSDGWDDVIVLSRADWDGSQWPQKSTLQFQKNNGDGTFTDVTSELLVDYNTDSSVTYHPLVGDFNKDGKKDIFVSFSDFGGVNVSSAFLLQGGDGRFVDTGREQVGAFIGDAGGSASLLSNGDDLYIVKMEQSYAGRAMVTIAPLSFPPRDQPETMVGSDADNVIFGFGGNDSIYGLSGSDRLVGGMGGDIIDLGMDSETDFVVYKSHLESSRRAIDQIVNFSSLADKVDLSGIDANAKLAGKQSFAFSGRRPRANSVWYRVSGENIFIFADINGNRTADFKVILRGVHALAAENFVL